VRPFLGVSEDLIRILGSIMQLLVIFEDECEVPLIETKIRTVLFRIRRGVSVRII
jgi:hypothetical protein